MNALKLKIERATKLLEGRKNPKSKEERLK